MKHTNRYSPELRERAVRLVLDPQGGHETQWAAIVSVSSKVAGLRMRKRVPHARPGTASRNRGAVDCIAFAEIRRAPPACPSRCPVGSRRVRMPLHGIACRDTLRTWHATASPNGPPERAGAGRR